MVCFKVLCRYFLGENEETHKNPRYSRQHGRDFNWAYYEYSYRGFEVLTVVVMKSSIF
jgi:hypothetical protein